MSTRVIIVGAGIIGMTVAVKLLENQFDVTIVTKDNPLKTNSDSAVATWYAPDDSRLYLQQLCLDSLPYFDELSKTVGSGVKRIPIVYFFKNQEDFEKSRWARASWKKLLQISDELPDNFVKNDTFTKAVSAYIPQIDMNIYRPFMLKNFEQFGGKLQMTKVHSLLDLADNADILINCAGWEAKHLVPDDEVYPVRGQIEIAVDAKNINQKYSVNIESIDAYAIFRPFSNDWVFGTTRKENDCTQENRETDIREIINKIRPFFPEITSLKTYSKVGVRCGRKLVRVEHELIKNNQGQQIPLIHCYGHGGSGVSASWASADEVLKRCFNF